MIAPWPLALLAATLAAFWLLAYADALMNELKVTSRVDFGTAHAIGPGKVALLEQMRECGSLSQAARELSMSYRRAWRLLNSLNQAFKEPLVLTSVGGAGGGGAVVTPLGEAVIASYREFELETRACAQRHFASLAKAVNPLASGKRRSMAQSLRADLPPRNARRRDAH